MLVDIPAKTYPVFAVGANVTSWLINTEEADNELELEVDDAGQIMLLSLYLYPTITFPPVAEFV